MTDNHFSESCYCISGGHEVGLKSLHPPPQSPTAREHLLQWCGWFGLEMKGWFQEALQECMAERQGGRENREAILCAGAAFGGQGGHAGCFYGDFSGLGSKLSRAALTGTNVWKIKGRDMYLLGGPSLYSLHLSANRIQIQEFSTQNCLRSSWE